MKFKEDLAIISIVFASILILLKLTGEFRNIDMIMAAWETGEHSVGADLFHMNVILIFLSIVSLVVSMFGFRHRSKYARQALKFNLSTCYLCSFPQDLLPMRSVQ